MGDELTVAAVIEKLSTLPSDAPVYIYHPDRDYGGYTESVDEVEFELNTGRVVFW